ncbi:hypothetical protein GGX14DRAFT_335354, partial [Mycena pura]
VTPTKRAMSAVLHEQNLSWDDIAAHPRLAGTTARSLARNYRKVEEHGGDFYLNLRKGRCGRKRRISEEGLQEAERALEAGEVVDGEDVRRVLFPDVPSRTVRNS